MSCIKARSVKKLRSAGQMDFRTVYEIICRGCFAPGKYPLSKISYLLVTIRKLKSRSLRTTTALRLLLLNMYWRTPLVRYQCTEFRILFDPEDSAGHYIIEDLSSQVSVYFLLGWSIISSGLVSVYPCGSCWSGISMSQRTLMVRYRYIL